MVIGASDFFSCRFGCGHTVTSGEGASMLCTPHVSSSCGLPVPVRTLRGYPGAGPLFRPPSAFSDWATPRSCDRSVSVCLSVGPRSRKPHAVLHRFLALGRPGGVTGLGSGRVDGSDSGMDETTTFAVRRKMGSGHRGVASGQLPIGTVSAGAKKVSMSRAP